mmetsp:Transcript_15035/g.22638  ORF Transcript_15035/g.22638 Transcript_15035/m.22638 type:complete len:370 (+) Transcript_15035:346-1455(+)|eukprot:scaffold5129_cov137-Skeletonema_dohrnii-CCMP3373.AAC.12
MFMPKLTLAAFTACAIRSSLAQDAPPTMNIVDTAIAAGTFTGLTGLVTLAGLGGALSDENASLTVFAPNDEALAKLDNATVAKLTDPLWLPQLQQLLLSHVLDIGAFTSDMVVDGMDAPTASGETFTVNTDPIRINEDSVVIAADIMATNGVIHVINNIITSQAVSQTIVDLMVADDNLSTLVAAATAADLVGAISADGPITCLGPTNEAFAALPEGTVDSLLLPENVDTLKDILLTHCISGNILSSMVTSGPITTLSGNTIEAVVNDDGSITFDGATVITADVVASNGIAHVIDKVIVPTSDEAAATTVAPTTTVAPKDDTHDDGDHTHDDGDDIAMDGVKDSPPSSAALYGTAVATAAVSAGFAMLI